MGVKNEFAFASGTEESRGRMARGWCCLLWTLRFVHCKISALYSSAGELVGQLLFLLLHIVENCKEGMVNSMLGVKISIRLWTCGVSKGWKKYDPGLGTTPVPCVFDHDCMSLPGQFWTSGQRTPLVLCVPELAVSTFFFLLISRGGVQQRRTQHVPFSLCISEGTNTSRSECCTKGWLVIY